VEPYLLCLNFFSFVGKHLGSHTKDGKKTFLSQNLVKIFQKCRNKKKINKNNYGRFLMFCFCFVPKGGANEHPSVSIFKVNEKYSSKKTSKNRVPQTHFFPQFQGLFKH
jgi:hypothetical protein